MVTVIVYTGMNYDSLEDLLKYPGKGAWNKYNHEFETLEAAADFIAIDKLNSGNRRYRMEVDGVMFPDLYSDNDGDNIDTIRGRKVERYGSNKYRYIDNGEEVEE